MEVVCGWEKMVHFPEWDIAVMSPVGLSPNLEIETIYISKCLLQFNVKF